MLPFVVDVFMLLLLFILDFIAFMSFFIALFISHVVIHLCFACFHRYLLLLFCFDLHLLINFSLFPSIPNTLFPLYLFLSLFTRPSSTLSKIQSKQLINTPSTIQPHINSSIMLKIYNIMRLPVCVCVFVCVYKCNVVLGQRLITTSHLIDDNRA